MKHKFVRIVKGGTRKMCRCCGKVIIERRRAMKIKASELTGPALG